MVWLVDKTKTLPKEMSVIPLGDVTPGRWFIKKQNKQVP